MGNRHRLFLEHAGVETGAFRAFRYPERPFTIQRDILLGEEAAGKEQEQKEDSFHDDSDWGLNKVRKNPAFVLFAIGQIIAQIGLSGIIVAVPRRREWIVFLFLHQTYWL